MTRLLLLVWAVCAAATGCKKKSEQPAVTEAPAITPAKDAADRGRTPESIVLSKITIRIAEPERAPKLIAADLAERLGAVLSASDNFVREGEPIPAGHNATMGHADVLVTYDLIEETTSGGPGVIAIIEAKVIRSDSSDVLFQENILAERPTESADESTVATAVFLEHVGQSVEKAGIGFIAQAELRNSDDADLLSALVHDDVSLVAYALELIGERKPAGSVEAVAPMLASADRTIHDAAVTALVALGDPAAVGPLTDGIDFTDYDNLRITIEAVAALGGDDAIEFLEFVASGHQDLDIKDRARDALTRIKERTGGRR